jgi:hypothetical protein
VRDVVLVHRGGRYVALLVSVVVAKRQHHDCDLSAKT